MMNRLALIALLAALATPAPTDAQDTALAMKGPPAAMVTARAIRARSIIGPQDVERGTERVPGALDDPADVIGQEALSWMQVGRPIMPEDVGPPALVERNQVVTMLFRRGSLEITAEGRALDRAAGGDRIRVMNLDSRTTVSATVIAPGIVEVR